MIQAKFSINEAQGEFINQFAELGFKDKSAVVRQALNCLMNILEDERMRQGAALYAEIYDQDKELQDLTRASMEDFNDIRTPSTRDDHQS